MKKYLGDGKEESEGAGPPEELFWQVPTKEKTTKPSTPHKSYDHLH